VTADLHTHTRHSDGLTTPSENAALAAAEGLAVVALTDHDTFAGLEEAAEACAARGLGFVPGVELSAEHDEVSIHVLGYWPDPEDPALAGECERLRTERDRRAAVMVERIRAAGGEVSLERVREIAGGAPVGRPHLAQAMVEAGVVADHQAAFDEWIGDDGRAYEPKRALHPVAAVQLLRGAGGVAVLAHPGASGRGAEAGVPLDLVDEMVAAGLAGIEADSTAHAPDVADRWREVARGRHLVVTGSSDFHGRRPGARLGERTTSQEALDALVAAVRGTEKGMRDMTRLRRSHRW
jgi:3',5'-nucleoside bisphosphate phosphatase